MSEVELTIRGFTSVNQMLHFMDWYAGQGEQDASIWFECRQDEGELDVSSMDASGSSVDHATNKAILRVRPR